MNIEGFKPMDYTRLARAPATVTEAGARQPRHWVPPTMPI